MPGLSEIWLAPLLPLLSSTILMLSAGKLPRAWVAWLGAGSVGMAALMVLGAGMEFLGVAAADRQPYSMFLAGWIRVGDFAPAFAIYLDGLTLVMLSVITGVGFLIHLYSTEFMADDSSFSRYFAYMNLFVSAMLILVMADNLLLLYLGWEGVGLCSYLLIGFWHQDPQNGWAARKAFVVTRVGDAAMALGLCLLFVELGTLEIQPLMAAAQLSWNVGDQLPILAAALILAGAVGKSAQLPLQTWLPDAMAGPTPVSALIHAATMVTAGVYLVARTHELFLLAPPVLFAVALLGLLTLLMAAFTALNQVDIKRILAYSTISQIGYMFLALGVGAWSAGIFHLMTHAFFKALLFLAAGVVIHCLHHEHNIFKMGGLRSRLPIVFWSFVIGSAALAALPLTAGYFSKEPILMAAWELPTAGRWLWAGGLAGAFVTALYSSRLVFVVFFGDARIEPDKRPGWRMSGSLAILCVLSLVGGWIILPLQAVFPEGAEHHPGRLIEWISVAVPLAGVVLGYLVYGGRQLRVDSLVESPPVLALRAYWHSGWGMDRLYDALLVRPFTGLSHALRNEPVDLGYNALVRTSLILHGWLSQLQNGRLRWYATSMVFGLILLIAILVAT